MLANDPYSFGNIIKDERTFHMQKMLDFIVKYIDPMNKQVKL